MARSSGPVVATCPGHFGHFGHFGSAGRHVGAAAPPPSKTSLTRMPRRSLPPLHLGSCGPRLRSWKPGAKLPISSPSPARGAGLTGSSGLGAGKLHHFYSSLPPQTHNCFNPQILSLVATLSHGTTAALVNAWMVHAWVLFDWFICGPTHRALKTRSCSRLNIYFFSPKKNWWYYPHQKDSVSPVRGI